MKKKENDRSNFKVRSVSDITKSEVEQCFTTLKIAGYNLSGEMSYKDIEAIIESAQEEGMVFPHLDYKKVMRDFNHDEEVLELREELKELFKEKIKKYGKEQS